MSSDKSIGQAVLSGTKWYIAMKWGIKSLGFISSMFLARLLMPEDFGLIATATVMYGFIALLFSFGTNWALIQNNKATDEHFDTAWTLKIIQATIIATVMFISSPWIASFVGDARVEYIITILCIATLCGGVENIGIVKFQKSLEFSKDFAFNIFPKLLSTIVTIALAFHYQSYLALIYGLLFNRIARLVISYFVVSYKPKLSFSKFDEIWGFSKWILVRNIAQYINNQGDILLLSMMTTTSKLGFYRWGSELSLMAITEIQQPFSRALTPGLAKIKDDHPRLISAYLKALSTMTLVAVPFALGFGAVANELIPLFLGGGDKWLPVVPIAEALVFFAMFTSMYGVSGSLLTINGFVKYTAATFWIQAIVTIATLYPAFYLADLEGVAQARIFIGFVMFVIISNIVSAKCDVAMIAILQAVWRPIVSGLLMYFFVINLGAFIPLTEAYLLISKIVIGAMLYSVCLLLLWLVVGAPKTIEYDALMIIKKHVAHFKGEHLKE